MSADTLCSSCALSIWCPTWTEWRCRKYEKRIYSKLTTCPEYKVRPKGFKEPMCQCEDCLKNELILDEMDEEKEAEAKSS